MLGFLYGVRTPSPDSGKKAEFGQVKFGRDPPFGLHASNGLTVGAKSNLGQSGWELDQTTALALRNHLASTD